MSPKCGQRPTSFNTHSSPLHFHADQSATLLPVFPFPPHDDWTFLWPSHLARRATMERLRDRSLTLGLWSRWVAPRSHRYEYAILAQRCSPSSKRERLIQSLGRSERVHADELDSDNIRLQRNTESTVSATAAEWERSAERLACLSKSHVSNATYRSNEAAASSRR